MVDALATIALEGILKKLSVAAANEVVLVWGYRERLDAFRNTVKMIHGKLRDAESQKGTKEGVMEWVKILKAVVGEADVVFDEIDYEMLRLEVKKRNKMERKVPSLPSLKKFTFRIRMGHKIEDISKKLSEILKLANDLGLNGEQVVHTPDSLYQGGTDSYLDGFKIVGRENDEEHIIQLLTRSRDEEKLVIVPIVGMGGIGKTTLAKSVYNNQKIEQDFDVKAWLCVSVKVDINTLLARIYESLTGNKCELPTRENLIASLRKKLGGKRYLLVLDDVWDERKDHWDDFKSCMLKVNSENGSSILVTSRNLEIGTNDMTKDSYTLKVLPDDQCWSIFEERAFVVGRPPIPELVEIGHDIVKKCHGLPLVASVIGAMLRRYYNDKEKWLSIKDNKVWNLEEGERVQSALKLSFDNLPNTVLKQCFAYCSTFPKDVFMEREQLIQFWMALGLLQADDQAINKEMEDVGNDIFQTLVSNSLLQDVEIDEYGHIRGCKMHDLVHDLSLSLTRHENLCLVDPTIDDDVRISQVKHLAMHHAWNMDDKIKISFREMISKVSKEAMTSRTIHTLIFIYGKVEKNISFRVFKSLRILKLRECNVKKIHNSIGDLVHLRYLDLSHTNINVLPRSIGKLFHLQTLKLVWCLHLKELPKDVKNLINLRHFEFDMHRLSPKVGQLTSLQTLSAFVVGQKKGYQIEELGHLKHLRGELRIFNLEKISSKEDAANANLSEKKNVFKIIFHWSNNEGANRNDKDVLEGLQPHANVKSLEIHNFSGDNLPTWVMKMAIDIQGKWTSLDELIKIRLSGCSRCHNFPMLGNLRHLRKLKLGNMDNVTCLGTSLGHGNVVTEPGKPLFPSLRSLLLMSMKSLEKWTDAGMNSSTMLSSVLKKLEIWFCPKIILLDEYHQHPLVSLVISDCENLQSIQSIQGLTSLESLSISGCNSLSRIPDLHSQGHSLKSLQITNCNKLTSLPRGLECLAFLNKLRLGPFSDELHSFPSLQGIDKLGSHLRSLQLDGCDHWKSIPEEVKHLTALTSLTIDGFGMQELPIWLRNMSSIRSMYFYDCKGLDIETVRRGAPREAIEVVLDHRVCI